MAIRMKTIKITDIIVLILKEKRLLRKKRGDILLLEIILEV